MREKPNSKYSCCGVAQLGCSVNPGSSRPPRSVAADCRFAEAETALAAKAVRMFGGQEPDKLGRDGLGGVAVVEVGPGVRESNGQVLVYFVLALLVESRSALGSIHYEDASRL